jgi:hypothetical protein
VFRSTAGRQVLLVRKEAAIVKVMRTAEKTIDHEGKEVKEK